VDFRHPGLPLRKIELIEASFARVEPRSRAMAIAFYDELFETLPGLRAVFPRDDLEQRRIVASFVGFVVTNLRSPHRLAMLLERMGSRGLLGDLNHEETAAICRVILMVLREYEGDRWTVETSHAWALGIAWTVSALRRGDHHQLARTG
jgi:hemoglobin-like flavoprotein